MKKLFNIFSTSFSIVGSVIGAGFITGREILSFFGGTNIVSTTVLLAVVFAIIFFLLLSQNSLPNNRFFSLFEPLILVGNLIIVSGMVSATDEVFCLAFGIPTYFPIFSILTLLFSYLVMKKGIDGLKKVNFYMTPIILLVTLIFVSSIDGANLSLDCDIKIHSIAFYVGMNTFMSSQVFIDLGKNLSRKEAFFTAIISSLIICFLILLIYAKITASIDNVLNSAIPLLKIISSKKWVILLFSLIMYLGIVTTLLGANYPLFIFCSTFKKENLWNIIILVVAFVISRFGFYNIINFCYPILGSIGVVYLVAIAINSFINKHKTNTSTENKKIVFK